MWLWGLGDFLPGCTHTSFASLLMLGWPWHIRWASCQKRLVPTFWAVSLLWERQTAFLGMELKGWVSGNYRERMHGFCPWEMEYKNHFSQTLFLGISLFLSTLSLRLKPPAEANKRRKQTGMSYTLEDCNNLKEVEPTMGGISVGDYSLYFLFLAKKKNWNILVLHK